MSAAQRIFERHLDDLRDDAQSQNLHFSDVLWRALDNRQIPENKILANLLRLPEDKVPHLVERYRVEFYEWLANTAIADAEEAHKAFFARKKGGVVRGTQRKKESLKMRAKILAIEAELCAANTKPHEINKRIAARLGISYDAVRKARRNRAKTRNAG